MTAEAPDALRTPEHVALAVPERDAAARDEQGRLDQGSEDEALLGLVDAAVGLGVRWLSVREPSRGRALRDRRAELARRGIRVLYDAGSTPGVAGLRSEAGAGPEPALTVLVATERSGRAEIVAAVQRLAEAGAVASEVDEEVLGAGLHAPDVDLLVLTGGDSRVPDLLLWEIAYSEIVVVDDPWPAIGPSHLQEAVAEYQRRDRRYGGLVTPGKGR